MTNWILFGVWLLPSGIAGIRLGWELNYGHLPLFLAIGAFFFGTSLLPSEELPVIILIGSLMALSLGLLVTYLPKWWETLWNLSTPQ